MVKSLAGSSDWFLIYGPEKTCSQVSKNEASRHQSLLFSGRVLFAHKVSKHTSTKFYPFFLMLNREPTLPIDVKYTLVGIEGNESEHPFDKETFYVGLTTTISMRANIQQTPVVQHKKNNPVIIMDAIKCLTRFKWVKKCF